MDILENKMKGTKVEGTIEAMLRGTESMIIECMKVDYSKCANQPFYGMEE